MDFLDPVDYLVVGHICRDLTPQGPVIGGTAAYSSATAQTLGCRTAVVTSYAAQDAWAEWLPDVEIYRLPSENTTTFENIYEQNKRVQTVHATAGDIRVADIPEAWRRSKIAHVGPVAAEIDPGVVTLFSNSLVGLTPQGWMRRWNENGRVYARAWDEAQDYLPLAAATFISDEDLVTPAMLNEFRAVSRILVMTQGAAGCIVYFNDAVRSVPAPTVKAVDLTGAGDVFAAAYLVRLLQTDGDPWEAARFANEIAAQSVTAVGLRNKMQAIRDYLQRGSR